MTPCEIQPSGRAKRAANFQCISERGETFPQVMDRYRAKGREFPSISEIRTLVVRAGRCLVYFDDETGEEKRLNSTHIHLWDLLLSFTNLRDWVAGQPVAWPSNQLIGKMLGIDPGYVPRLLRGLEAVGACIREYTHRNRRHGAGGIDMASTFFLLAAATFPCFSMASSPVTDGKVLFVIDGDTYQISHAGTPDGEPVRARHFDTPEKGDRAQCRAEREKAGQASTFARRLLPRGAVVMLSDLGRDRYGRLLGTVTLPDGIDIAALLIGAGLARPYEGGRKPGWCAPFGAP